jgi:hypothetical protein
VKEQDHKIVRPAPSGRLKAAIREARLAQVEHSDAMADLRAADMAHLELLGEELKPVLDELPPHADQFDFQIVGGEQPRMWIDMLAYVRMGRDRRSYQVMKSTRTGRKLLFEGTDVKLVGKAVTDYIAHQFIEREKAITAEEEVEAREAVLRRDGGGYRNLISFVLGFVLGGAAVMLIKWLVSSDLI